MAETKKEEVVDSTTEQPKIDNKVKKPKVKKFSKKEEITKINLNKQPEEKEENIVKVDLTKPSKTEENADTKQEATDVASDKQAKVIEEVVEEVPQGETTVQDEAAPIVEEITKEEKKEVKKKEEEIVKAVEEAEASGKPLPENIEKLMNFMEETGGDLEDYVKLNRDTTKLDDQDVLYEYYKQTKPHLNNEEINFIMEDQFSYNEENDEEKTIKRKKLALKEQVASARAHLDGQKSKYYEEIKAGSKLTSEQQKAVDFFNRYNKESEQSKKVANEQKSNFLKKTDDVFDQDFKGFEYKVGEKKFRYNVKDVNQTKENQSDINNFVKKFLNEKNSMEDASGYHKGLYTAMNADSIAQHFYEQGKADAIKDTVANNKNININPRQSHDKINTSGMKFKVLGDNSADFKFKIKIIK